jgi:ubiquitin thioesterase protein OTUB1
MSEPSDEQILQFEQEIKDAEAKKQQLIGPFESIEELYKEYELGSPIFCQKILSLSESYKGFRRSRGDGNCFFRSFIFAWFERAILFGSEVFEKTRQRLVESKNDLLLVGFDWKALEDFYELTIELLDLVTRKSITDPIELSNELEKVFNSEQGVYSNAAIVHLRMLTSSYLRLHSDEYLPFIENANNMDQYCSKEVEAFGRESEDIHIIALSKTLGVTIKIVYLDGSSSETQIHTFKGDETVNDDELPPITLLYRPGHYDILYQK